MSGALRATPGWVPAPSRLRWSSAATLVLMLLVAPSAHAQEATTATPTGPPSWVSVGTQVSYELAQATLPGGVYELVEDPTGPLVDPATGTRYRESYGGAVTGGGAPPDGGAGTSGQGFLQYAVAALDGSDVLLSVATVLEDPISGTRYAAPAQVARAPAAAPGLPWIHPDILAGYRSGTPAQRLVLTGEQELGGTTYRTLSVIDPTAGSYSMLTYDAESGLLLRSASRTQAQAGGQAVLGTLELQAVREPSTPGLGAPVPSWLTTSTTLRYAGTQRWTNTLDGSWQEFPVTLEATFPEVGPTWARYATATTVTMLTPVAGTGEGIVAGTGPYWYDPTALAAMTEGQMLDLDPVTGQTVSVARIVQGSSGPVVVIGSRMGGVEGEAAWDVGTGVMLAQQVSTQASGIATSIELQSMP